MASRIYVRVVGFTDAERHALNTVFRLSLERDVHYALWTRSAPQPALLALVDGESLEAGVWLQQLPADHAGQLFWVGPFAPAYAHHVFRRPLRWPQVVEAMDEFFSPIISKLPDLDLSGPTPLAHLDGSSGHVSDKSALVVDANNDTRRWLRSQLAQFGVHAVDETTSALQAKALTRRKRYDVAVVDMDLPGAEMEMSQCVSALRNAKNAVPLVIMQVRRASLLTRLQGVLHGGTVVLPKPLDEGSLQHVLMSELQK